MWAFADQCLHLRGDEFWTLSPREFFKLAEIWKREQTMLNYRAGITAANILNVHRQKNSDRIWQPLDFFRTDEELLPECRTAEEIEAQMDALDKIIKR